jgi:hypothetical protein
VKEVLEAIADCMIAAEETGVTPRDLRVADGVQAYILTLPAHMQREIRLLITLFEFLPALIIFKLRRFSRLKRMDQERYIEAWGCSRISLLRTGFRVLKSLCVSTYYQNPTAWNAIGYRT